MAGRGASGADPAPGARPGAAAAEPGSCVFCAIAAGRAPAEFVLESPGVLGFLDRRPLFPGHVLVVPRAHYATLGDLPEPAVAPLFLEARRIARAVEAALGAEGSFVALNNRVSQSVPHLHIHVVPRRRGDGLRGFFWPRHGYDDAAHRTRTRDAIRAALAAGPPPAPG